MKRKKILIFLLLTIVFFEIGGGAGVSAAGAASPRFGVFVGLNPENMEKLRGYDIVVIDAAYYSKKQIATLHKWGATVFSYLNIGSLETYRDYDQKFKEITLGEYEGWPDERWVDVSSVKWRRYLVDVAAKELQEKGVDGFFLDNADVYEVYPREKIYRGLFRMIKELKERRGLDLILNGGNAFVRKAAKETPLKEILYGVNQESVFTEADYDNGDLLTQDKEITAVYKSYLSFCQKQGLRVFLTEYAAEGDTSLRRRIKRYCGKKGYSYYIAPSLALT